MRKILGTFVLLVFLPIAVVQAQDTFDDAPLLQGRDTSFENPNEALGKVSLIRMPNCSDQAFEKRVKGEVVAFLNASKATSSIAQRKNALINANIEGFEEVDVASFTPQTDYNTANALITLKINSKISAKTMRLCRQKGEGNLYVIMYPYQDNIKVHIINLDRFDIKNEGVHFIYP